MQQARLIGERVRVKAEQAGDWFLLGQVLINESFIETEAGNFEQAQTALEDALELFRKNGAPRRFWLRALGNVGWVALQRNDLTRARAALEEYLAESGTGPIGTAYGLAHLGLVAVYEGERDEADRCFRQSLAYASVRTTRAVSQGLFGLGAVAAMDRNGERAVRLWSAANAVKDRAQSPLTKPEHFIAERHLQPAGALIPDDIRDRARREGAAMSVEEAIAYALDEPETSLSPNSRAQHSAQ